MKRAASVFTLTILLFSILIGASSSILFVKAEEAIFIRADGSIDPPTAPISTVDNVTYTFTNNINDSIVVERDNIVVDGEGYTIQGTGVEQSKGISLAGRSNVTIKRAAIRGFYHGIAVFHSSNNSVSGNNITNNECGISIDFLSNNTSVSGNNITNNDFYGIGLSSSNYNSVSGNNITNNYWYGIYLGIWLEYSSNYNSVSGNKITNNYNIGVYIDSSSNNSVSGNKITNNGAGIYLTNSSNNSISGNEVTNNDCDGIYLRYSHGNLVHHNNFIDNTWQVYSYYSTNVWDNGCEGNYWSNYNGTDLNSDGIGDTYLPWEGVDSYPLMNLYWNPADIDHDLDVDIFDIVRCAGAYGSTPSDSNWNPHCDIAKPYGKIDIFDIVTIAMSYGKEYAP